jgi:acyl carrier protein
MTRQEQILEFINTNLVTDTKLAFDPTRDLLENGVLDSVAMMELIVWIEETFKIAIDAEDLTPENFATLDAIDRYIEGASEASGS